MKKHIVLVFLGCAMALNAHADSEGFENASPGALPGGWVAGVTGSGNPKWAVGADPTAPGGKQVLQQTGSGAFPWCVKKSVALADGFVEVKFKPLAGKEDQAGGVVWRWKDGDNYYVARANALENNVSLYYTANGRRITIKYVDAPVPGARWHVLRVELAGARIKVLLDGKAYIEAGDETNAGARAAGVWAKAHIGT